MERRRPRGADDDNRQHAAAVRREPRRRDTEVGGQPADAAATEHLAAALRSARAVQAADRLALGEMYQASGYVVVDEAGDPLSPHALTSRWSRMLKAAGVRHIRLHDARHTCGTLMHLENVPIALISAWLGHASKAFTMATYVHSQPDALAAAALSFGRVGESRHKPD